MKAFVGAIFLLALGAARSFGAGEIGMPAPPLSIGAWVKGDPVKLAGPGGGTNVTVVEFWATWCAPCRVSIPHLTKLQKRFRDRGVVILGVSDEATNKVAAFVKEMGDQMDYTVAVDEGGKTGQAYMKAFGIDGIPHAFIVDRDGRIAWQGHPMVGLDEALEDVVEGRHDIDAARRAMVAARNMREYFEKVVDGAAAKEAQPLGEKIVRDGAEMPMLLNEFAWIILTHPRIANRDLNLAMKAARLAYEKTGGTDASVNDTYARAFFETGNLNEAIEMQKKAVEAALDADEREQLQDTLRSYQSRLK
jgi:thiol-disulfide isomerase/thioredoxin